MSVHGPSLAGGQDFQAVADFGRQMGRNRHGAGATGLASRGLGHGRAFCVNTTRRKLYTYGVGLLR
jgi:hypothetical protein